MTAPPSRVHLRRATLGDEARQRVLRRALELADSAETVVSDDEAALTAAATELGIAPSFVTQAIAEERAGLLAPSALSFLDRLAGPAAAVATMRVERAEPLAAVGFWLERAHSLRRVQADTTQGVWVRRSDLVAAARRTMAGVTGSGALGDRREVRVTATPAGDDAWLVRLEADVHRQRVVHISAGATMSGTGLSLVALGASGALLAPAAFVGAPAAVGGLLLVRSNRNRVRRVEHELLRVLDAVARGQAPLGPLDAVQSLLGRHR